MHHIVLPGHSIRDLLGMIFGDLLEGLVGKVTSSSGMEKFGHELNHLVHDDLIPGFHHFKPGNPLPNRKTATLTSHVQGLKPEVSVVRFKE